MKKFVKIILIISASLLGLGLLVTVAGFAWSYRFTSRMAETDSAIVMQTEDRTYPVDAANLDSLSVSLGLADVKFVLTEDASQARVETTGFNEGELTVKQEAGLLTIRSRRIPGSGFSLFDLGLFRVDWQGRVHMNRSMSRTATFYLPKSALDQVSFDGGVGDLSGELPFSAESMSFSCGTGDVTLSNLHAKSLTVSGGVGEVTLKDFSAETFDFSGGTGDVTLKDGSVTKRTSISGGVFSIDAEDVEFYNLTLSGGTGDIDFSGTLRGKCQVEGGVGNVSLRFSDSAENYSMRLERGVGSMRAHNADMVVGEDGDYAINPRLNTGNTVEISMGVGDVDVSFAQ
jgi:hypothetical protein